MEIRNEGCKAKQLDDDDADNLPLDTGPHEVVVTSSFIGQPWRWRILFLFFMQEVNYLVAAGSSIRFMTFLARYRRYLLILLALA